MIVSTRKLESDLRELQSSLRAEGLDPQAGLFGPDSVFWLVNREIIVFLCGGRAALLQMAHPSVAYAIEQHSDTRHDPLGRFQRTFEHVFAMAFGDIDHAIASARRVHAIHARVSGRIDEPVGPFAQGNEYRANDADALFWVHATLVDSAVCAYELVMRPLTGDECERYYAESKRFAKLFGIPERVIPDSWNAFQRYNERMWQRLEVTRPAREMGQFLLHDEALRTKTLARWYRLMTAGLLPEPLRAPFGLRFGDRQRLAFETSVRGLRAVYRAVPSRLRWLPAYADARRRLAGKPGRDRLGKMIERYVFEAAIKGRSAR
jgi:uncharacterized protein (DUF2236 family)